jgi:signal transduction histidine kinase
VLLGQIEQTDDEPGLLERCRGLHARSAPSAIGYEATRRILGRIDGAEPPARRREHPRAPADGTRPAGALARRRRGARTAPPALGQDFLEAPLLLPVRRGRELAVFVALGPKRSGDVYTASDLALLSAVGDAGTRQLERLQVADVLAREREHRREEARQRRAAEDAHFARSRHLAAASHDLRQPLHALGLFADALEKRVPDDEARELVQRMRSSASAARDVRLPDRRLAARAGRRPSHVGRRRARSAARAPGR